MSNWTSDRHCNRAFFFFNNLRFLQEFLKSMINLVLVKI